MDQLKKDPIIIQMAKQVQSTKKDLNSHQMMIMALRYYTDNGGKIASHIGGPIEAVKELVNESKAKG